MENIFYSLLQLTLHLLLKMLAKTILVIFLFNKLICGENIFFKKLNRLLDYCDKNQKQVDDGTLLGISFAKGILSSRNVNNLELRSLFNKCEHLGKTSTSASNEISEY